MVANPEFLHDHVRDDRPKAHQLGAVESHHPEDHTGAALGFRGRKKLGMRDLGAAWGVRLRGGIPSIHCVDDPSGTRPPWPARGGILPGVANGGRPTRRIHASADRLGVTRDSWGAQLFDGAPQAPARKQTDRSAAKPAFGVTKGGRLPVYPPQSLRPTPGNLTSPWPTHSFVQRWRLHLSACRVKNGV